MSENAPARPEIQPSPGWYPQGDSVRWWDGEKWAGLGYEQHAPVATSQAALWSVILGAVGLLISPLALVGLPLALVARRDVRSGARAGAGLATAGLVLNGITWVMWAGLFVYLAAS